MITDTKEEVHINLMYNECFTIPFIVITETNMLHRPSRDGNKSYCHNQTQDTEMSDACSHQTELVDNFHVNKLTCIIFMQDT